MLLKVKKLWIAAKLTNRDINQLWLEENYDKMNLIKSKFI